MSVTRSISLFLVAALAFSAAPSFAEGEDAPLPGDFQAAPAARAPKAKPLSLPPVSQVAAASQDGAPTARSAGRKAAGKPKTVAKRKAATRSKQLRKPPRGKPQAKAAVGKRGKSTIGKAPRQQLRKAGKSPRRHLSAASKRGKPADKLAARKKKAAPAMTKSKRKPATHKAGKRRTRR